MDNICYNICQGIVTGLTGRQGVVRPTKFLFKKINNMVSRESKKRISCSFLAAPTVLDKTDFTQATHNILAIAPTIIYLKGFAATSLTVPSP